MHYTLQHIAHISGFPLEQTSIELLTDSPLFDIPEIHEILVGLCRLVEVDGRLYM